MLTALPYHRSVHRRAEASSRKPTNDSWPRAKHCFLLWLYGLSPSLHTCFLLLLPTALIRRVVSAQPREGFNTISDFRLRTQDATEGVLPLIRALLPAEPAQGEHEARGGAEEAEGPAVACVLSPQAEASALQADSATTRALYNQRVWHRALHNIYNPGRPAPRLTGAPPALTEEEREEYYRHLDQQYQRARDARKNERLSLLQAAASQQQKKSLWKRVKAALPGRR